MKNFILAVALLISMNPSFGQLKKGSWVIGGSIKYNTQKQEGNTDNGQPYLGGNTINYILSGNSVQGNIPNPYTDEYYINNKSTSLALSPTISYFLSDHLFVGIGFVYQNNSTDNFKRRVTKNTQENTTFTQETTSTVLEKANEPFVMLGYWKAISPKLFFSTTLNIGVLNSSTDNTTTTLANRTPITSPDYTTYARFGYQKKYYTFRLKPSIGYLVSNSVGLNLTFGGLSYENNFVSKAGIQNDNVTFNLNPKNWEFGLFYYLNKK